MSEKKRNDAEKGENKDKPGHGKRILLRTFGCQMNVRDSEFVTGLLLEKGFKQAAQAEDADVVLFNTCSVRSHAEERAIHNVWDLKPLKKKKPDLILGIIGCMAQAKKEEILEKIPLVDFVCGPDDESDIPKLIKSILDERTKIAAVQNLGRTSKEFFPQYRESGIKAFVSISRGCDNFCSYCIVPYVRGKERSRRPKDILKEIRNLSRRGFKEVTLLGQNVNSYRDSSNQLRVTSGQRRDFIKLLEKINSVDGIERIRFMTSHPKDASTELFKAIRDLEKVCEHLHLPLQAGSDRILKLMKRGYSSSVFRRLIDQYRRFVPEGSITTDIIVGFPSENDKDFSKTKALMEAIEFDSAFIFKYSPRSPAKASLLNNDVPETVKRSRNSLLLELQAGISEKKNRGLIGSTQEVLVEGDARRRGVIGGHTRCRNVSDALTGRTRGNKIAVCEGRRGNIGRCVHAVIEDATCHTLIGSIR